MDSQAVGSKKRNLIKNNTKKIIKSAPWSDSICLVKERYDSCLVKEAVVGRVPQRTWSILPKASFTPLFTPEPWAAVLWSWLSCLFRWCGRVRGPYLGQDL